MTLPDLTRLALIFSFGPTVVCASRFPPESVNRYFRVRALKLPIQIDYQPAEKNEVFVFRRQVRRMVIASIPCIANLLLIATLCFDPAWGDKDYGTLLDLSFFALPFVGFGAAIIGTVIYARSAKTDLSNFLAIIFAATILCDLGGVIYFALGGAGMG